MTDIEFELIPTTREEFEEDIRRAKKKRRNYRGSHLHVDPVEQEYLWRTTGRKIQLINDRLVTITKT